MATALNLPEINSKVRAWEGGTVSKRQFISDASAVTFEREIMAAMLAEFRITKKKGQLFSTNQTI